jgi:hypothetical protein
MALVFLKNKLILFYKSKSFKKNMVGVLLIGIMFLVHLNNNYDKDEFDRYPLIFSKKEAWQVDIGKGWRSLNEQTKNGARVAYTGRMEFYPLYGSKIKNVVKYISINEKEIIPYNHPDGVCRKIKDFLAWKNNLTKAKIEYLFVALPFFDNRETQDSDRFPIEDEWAVNHPADFQLVFSNSLSHIYKVLLN